MPRVHTHTTQYQPTAAFTGTDGYSRAQPLLYPLIYLIDHLALRSSATQSLFTSSAQVFYEFWHQKHGMTFASVSIPRTTIHWLPLLWTPAFFHYLENTHLYVPALTIRSTTQTTPQRRTNIEHVHSVIRFYQIFEINTYISPRYIDGSPKELTRLATQLTGRLSIHKAEFHYSAHSRQMNNGTTHKALSKSDCWDGHGFTKIITPGSISRKTHLIPSRWWNPAT